MWVWLANLLGNSSKNTEDANTVFIDSVKGNDSTGKRGDKTKPFKTIDAGVAAATTGDALSITAGNYPT